ncbi:hypothetical protein [uncultured Bacteroides sp.]|uniref:hypothetical protein n=1 Tax=uncultured Bacteroides sp. TaxID=162156 RepID=UPI0025E0E416|nr:hypothetical protein [uncultured Bacteroides sp.]
MRKETLLLILLCITLSCTSFRDNIKYDNNRDMIKELFLYKCISYGYPDMKLSQYDNSAAVYLELSHYAPEAYLKIDSLAKYFVSNIGYEDTYYENKKTKSLFLQSMEYFKSSKLEDFIESLDIYRYK